MLPTFVIGLREGLEAALIVGIIAAFLRKQGRRDLLVAVLAGVGAAVLLCVTAGVALDVYSKNLPQRQQEALETVIGVLAVGMVTYMVVWMRRNSRHLKGQLEGLAADALAHDGAERAGRAMVLMAFLAVIREGLETVVFLLAAFNESGSGPSAGVGAILGIAVSVVLGYAIYRGGVRLNLSKFFRATGLVLVLVAAGLVVNALHTAHEAGWLEAGQGSTVDLSRLVRPGTVQASLLTGMLGIQSHPVVVEVIGWLLYLVPVGCYVAWAPGRPVPARLAARISSVVAVAAAVGALLIAVLAPSAPGSRPVTRAAATTALIESRTADRLAVRTEDAQPVTGRAGPVRQLRLSAAGSAVRAGLATDVYRSEQAGPVPAGRPPALDTATIAALNGGRLPIGLKPAAGRSPATYSDVRMLTVWVDARTDRVVDLAWTERVTASVASAGRVYALPRPVATARTALPEPAVTAATAAARADHAALVRRSVLRTTAGWCAVAAALTALAAAGFAFAGRRRAVTAPRVEPVGELVRS
jgi:high-affinity iron transporter